MRKNAQNTDMNRNFPAFCAAMLAFALFIVAFGGLWMKNPTAFAETEKVVYLTFDDGPSDRVTPKILDILAEENIKATFFIIGKQAVTRQNIVKRAHDEGHTIAIHSYTHDYGEIYASPENLIKDIDLCNEVIRMITGEYTDLYRFPGGSYNLSEPLITAVTTHGLRYVDWNASVRDAEIYHATPAQLYKAAISTSAQSDRVILLAHDSTSKSTTVDALKDIIGYFKAKGFVFKAL